MSYEDNLKTAAFACVCNMSFDDRDLFVRSHVYKQSGRISMQLNTVGLNRKKSVARYIPHYSLDNLYEYCVFKNIISLLNSYGRLKGKRQFTLGHFKPLDKGGSHEASNWIIQTDEDNQRQGNKLMDCEYKWSFKEQMDYIMSKINFNFVDDVYLPLFRHYAVMLPKVYNGQEKEKSAIPSKFCC